MEDSIINKPRKFWIVIRGNGKTGQIHFKEKNATQEAEHIATTERVIAYVMEADYAFEPETKVNRHFLINENLNNDCD
jgi:hypothetical protein